jgi:plastocyanin
MALVSGCSSNTTKENPSVSKEPAEPAYFKADPATAATLTGKIRFTGRRPAPKVIDMDQEPECARLHKNGRILEESILVGSGGALRNVFVYLKSGMEGRKFEVPAAPVTIDQKGCWFEPRVIGIQTGQTLQVTNSDPVTHNIHPLAQVNREWNQSQSQGDPPLSRRFVRPEILIPVKCNIHRWMRAFIGVVDHPYFAVTGADGSFEVNTVPPGTYTVAAVHEALGTQEQEVTLGASGKVSLNFTFRGK